MRLKKGERPTYIVTEGSAIRSISSKASSFQVEIFPTLQCNLRCPHCDRSGEKSVLRDFNDIKILYDNLQKDVIFSISNFRITGGEPTIYPRINGLISFLHGLAPYSKIDFITNGLMLKKIAKNHIKKLNLSVSIYPNTIGILKKSKYTRHNSTTLK